MAYGSSGKTIPKNISLSEIYDKKTKVEDLIDISETDRSNIKQIYTYYHIKHSKNFGFSYDLDFLHGILYIHDILNKPVEEYLKQIEYQGTTIEKSLSEIEDYIRYNSGRIKKLESVFFSDILSDTFYKKDFLSRLQSMMGLL